MPFETFADPSFMIIIIFETALSVDNNQYINQNWL